MITKDTPTRISELGTLLSTASFELEKIFNEISAESDAQLARAAAAFVVAYKDRVPVFKYYTDARRELTKAAGAASNIDELWRQTNSLRGSCVFWENIASGLDQKKGSRNHEIIAVCDKAASAEKADHGHVD
jgi:hypothetical protein